MGSKVGARAIMAGGRRAGGAGRVGRRARRRGAGARGADASASRCSSRRRPAAAARACASCARRRRWPRRWRRRGARRSAPSATTRCCSSATSTRRATSRCRSSATRTAASCTCFERECSIQRRYQKIIEEAPSPAVDAALRARMGAAAVAAGAAIGYVGAGTVEFIVDQQRRASTSSRSTRGCRSSTRSPRRSPASTWSSCRSASPRASRCRATQDDAAPSTATRIEARLYAEDPARDFLPATGRLVLWEPPALPGVRCDSGVEAGSEVSVHYDPLLAKIIAHGADARRGAADRLIAALRGLAVGGRDDQPRLPARRARPSRHFAPGRSTRTSSTDICRPRRARRRAMPAADRVHAIVAAIDGHERRRAAGGRRCRRAFRRAGATTAGGRRTSTFRDRRRAARGALRGRGRRRVHGRVRRQRSRARRVRGVEPDAIALEIDGVRRRFLVAVDGDDDLPARPARRRDADRAAALPVARRRRAGQRLPRADAGHRPPGAGRSPAIGSRRAP